VSWGTRPIRCPQFRVVRVQVAVVVQDRTLGGAGRIPGQRTQQGRLTGAAGADHHADQGALADREAHMVEQDRPSPPGKADREVLGDE